MVLRKTSFANYVLLQQRGTQEAQTLSDCSRSTGAFRLYKKHRRFQTVQEAQALSDCTRSTGAFRLYKKHRRFQTVRLLFEPNSVTNTCREQIANLEVVGRVSSVLTLSMHLMQSLRLILSDLDSRQNSKEVEVFVRVNIHIEEVRSNNFTQEFVESLKTPMRTPKQERKGRKQSLC